MNITSWLKDRLGLSWLLDHTVPSHANGPTYVIGGSILVLGILQVITGVLLQQVYNPGPSWSSAYASIQYIINSPQWNFVRNLHYWGGQLIFVLVIIHMIRVYVSGAYKRPRELLWVSGAILLLLSWLLLFTGTVLKADQEGAEALGHASEIASFFGPLGFWFNPSFAPNVSMLTKLYGAHVTILPLLVFALVVAHIYMIRTQGISSPTLKHVSHEKQLPFSTHIVKIVEYGSLAAAFAVILSLSVQPPFSTIANTAIEVTKPDWYMMWLISLEDFLGITSLPYLVFPAVILLLIVPAIDRGAEMDPRKRKLMIALLIFTIVVFALLTILGVALPPKSHLG